MENDAANVSSSICVDKLVLCTDDIRNFKDDTYAIDTDNERKNKYMRYSAEYNRQLGRKLDTTLGVSHLDRESSANADNYKEGRVYFQVKKGF